MATTRRNNSEGSINWWPEKGRYRGRIWLGGKRHAVYGTSRKQVMEKMRVLSKKTGHGVSLDRKATRVTVGEYLSEWIRNRADDTVKPLRPKTLQSYRYLLRFHVIPAIGTLLLSELSTPQVQAFLTKLSKQPLQGTLKNQDRLLSPRTIAYIKGLLRNALNPDVVHRVTGQWITEHNPAYLVQTARVDKPRLYPYSWAEAGRLIKGVQDHRLGPLFAFAILTGCREGEVLGLRWSAVDMEEGGCYIRSTLHRRDGEWFFDPPKSEKSERWVQFAPELLSILAKHRERQNVERLWAGEKWQAYDCVFSTAWGGPLSARNVVQTLHDLQTKLGLPQQRFHDLRHATANLLLGQGVPLDQVSSILGHSQISVTHEYYSHMQRDQKRKAMGTLAGLGA
jgi:integrase